MGCSVGGKVLVYGDAGDRIKAVPYVLFTEARRDVVWAGAPLVSRGAAAVVPERERALFEDPGAFWAAYETQRFHDYSQVNTKVLREPMRVSRAVHGGEVLDLDGVRVEVIDTPGYTRGAVSYLMETGGKRIACTGDLIYGDGQLFDLSSLQDAIPEAKARGYHGYAARAGELIASLRTIAARKPDVLVPARGPLIENPQQAINLLIARLQALMASHFRHRRAALVLGRRQPAHSVACGAGWAAGGFHAHGRTAPAARLGHWRSAIPACCSLRPAPAS